MNGKTSLNLASQDKLKRSEIEEIKDRLHKLEVQETLTASLVAILAGQAGGQVLNGGTANGNNLTLVSTAGATKGKVILGSAGTSAYDEVNDRLGIGTATPDTRLHAFKGSAGNVAAVANASLCAENSGDNVLQLLCPDANINAIYFGNPTTNDNMRIEHDRANGNLTFVITTAGRVRLNGTNNSFEPVTDQGQALGRSTQRWSAVWAGNGTIQTSDEREKQSIKHKPLGLDFIKRLNPLSWRWKDKRDTKEHHGLSAQEVKAVTDELGVEFGGHVYDAETDVHGLNYAEFIAPLIRAVQELAQRMEQLEGEL